MFNDRLGVHNNMYNGKNTTYLAHMHTLQWAPAEGGGGVENRRSQPPTPHRKSDIFFGYMSLLATFSPCGGLFGTFFSLWGALFTM